MRRLDIPIVNCIYTIFIVLIILDKIDARAIICSLIFGLYVIYAIYNFFYFKNKAKKVSGKDT